MFPNLPTLIVLPLPCVPNSGEEFGADGPSMDATHAADVRPPTRSITRQRAHSPPRHNHFPHPLYHMNTSGGSHIPHRDTKNDVRSRRTPHSHGRACCFLAFRQSLHGVPFALHLIQHQTELHTSMEGVRHMWDGTTRAGDAQKMSAAATHARMHPASKFDFWTSRNRPRGERQGAYCIELQRRAVRHPHTISTSPMFPLHLPHANSIFGRPAGGPAASRERY
ncbi:hypothetical protein HYPSUDRAFT_201399 [Hypholoma sublateritium FD-334 SS-4]|uniref:Uncharacterized protein n=1 Tax=Hypholoma sublateritium (strain FD-334 SS-4) TaxID=945553 RepID=A0A0D2PUV1_HYPSF|nr:hypothetical protein HYPSUDRAFT_201399 [Hypholoma sublateritium FD-334 SS-4]